MLSALIAANPAFPLLEQGFTINLNGLGQFVRVIIESVGMVGVGVIVFALILKAITTPFDIYQRVKMRKQSLIMRKLQPELEKLQKQYANDKQTYQMKMMELQKKNGYSLLGACLPMIISFVILIVAITAFQSYASYANLAMYEQMAEGYNSAILAHAVDGGILVGEGEEAVRVDYRRSDIDWTWELGVPHEEENILYTVYLDGTTTRMEVRSADESVWLYYTYELDSNEMSREYYVDVDRMYTGQKDAAVKEAIDTDIAQGLTAGEACLGYLRHLGADESARVFREMRNPGFLWVKNVWYPDVSYNHPIQDYGSFTSTFANSKIYVDRTVPDEEGGFRTETAERRIADIFSESEYNSLTAGLEEEKEQANGYFIMIILSIGLMLLSQFVMMRSQKESDQFQTVDGQGARTQKIMMVIMPLMFAVFGFMWSAAFTIYNVISSFISIVVTLLTNLIIGRVFKKQEEEELKQRYTRTVPWKREPESKKNRKK